MKDVIGIVGENGAGKDTVAKFLMQKFARQRASHIHFSDPLFAELAWRKVVPTRGALQSLAREWKEEEPVRLSRKVGEKAIYALASGAEKVILNGLRWETDLDMLRKFPFHFLIYVTAEKEIRFERLRARKEKAGEDEMTWEQFMETETAENEIHIPKIAAHAHSKLLNNYSNYKDFEPNLEIMYNYSYLNFLQHARSMC